jgi:peptide/nickel transport system substrate-binding protein
MINTKENTMKTTYIIAVVIAAVVVVGAIAGYLLYPSLSPEKTLIWGTTEDMFGVFPAISRTYATYLPCSAIFETLVGYKSETAEVIPLLATEWEAISPMIWEFKLREGVKFHDGTAFNASAVKFSLEKTIDDPDRPWGTSQLGRYVDHVDVIDDYTVRVHVPSPGHAGLPSLIGFNVAGIYSPTAYIKAGEEFATEGAVGTGPFKFVSWKVGETIIEANKEYWDADRIPNVDKIIFKGFQDSGALKLALENGEIDVAHRWMYPDDVDDLCNNPDIHVKEGTDPYTYMLALHNNMSYTNQTEVRQAIAYSIDYQAITEIIDSDRAVSLMSPQWPYANNVQSMFYRNITKAKELLANAGYPEGLPGEIEMFWTSDFGPAFEQIASLIQSNLADAGITIKLQSSEWTTMLQYRSQGTMHMALVRSAFTFPDPDYMCMFFVYSGGSYPKGFSFGYPEVDDLYAQGALETNEEARIEIYKEIQEIFDPKAHLIYLFRVKMYVFYREGVDNVIVDSAIYHNLARSFTEITID